MKIRSSAAWVLATSALLPICAIANEQANPMSHLDLTAAHAKQIHYKFLLMSPKAEMKLTSPGHYTLTLFKPSVVHYRAIAPNRESGNISLEDFSQYWAPGGSFSSIPPNAFVASNDPQTLPNGKQIAQQAPYDVTLRAVTYKKGDKFIRFDCTKEEGGQAMLPAVTMKNVALIVDDSGGGFG